MEKLSSEMKKDQAQTDRIKEKQISEVLSLDKSMMFAKPKKTSVWMKLKIVLGYGRKKG